MQDGPYREVPLYNQKGRVVAHAKVSPEDFERISAHRWHRTRAGYAKRGKLLGERRVTISMARTILDVAADDLSVVDHINRDKLDNRRENLRVVSFAENTQNASPRAGSSRFRGVMFHKSSGKWAAAIQKTHLGLYDTEVEAAAAARGARKALFPFAED